MPQASAQVKRHLRIPAPRVITLSFVLIILVGATLLNLPIASRDSNSIGFLDALFTATSASCVTGLIPVNTLAQWTTFGHVVIILLIQLGGLGLITIMTAGIVALQKRVGLENRLLIQASFNQESVGGMVRLVRMVVFTTLAFEGIGAVLLTFGFYFSTPGLSFGKAIWWGVFQSISSFCNAGFDIVSSNSLVPYQTNFFINIVIMALIVSGGLGFTVWGELFYNKKHGGKSWKKRLRFLSVHSRIAIIATAVLLIGGAVLFMIVEWNNPNTLGPLETRHKVLASFFQSVTLRTCGYNSIDQGGLTESSKVLSSILMFIGGSPGGTAGGVKTVSLSVLLIAMISVVRGRDRLSAFGRSLPFDQLQKSLSVFFMLLTLVLVSTFVLSYTERDIPFQHGFVDLLFEVASGAGTVGVTTGITPYLSGAGKIVLILCMLLGRLSPTTFVLAINAKSSNKKDKITYPYERVIIG